ncbi:MAG: PhoH family protein [Halanaerobiales bacterium]
MKKNFVLDTNVLLMDPQAIFSFEENDVVIPLAVVEEIDDQKNKSSDIGYNARETSRLLDELRLKGKLSKGIELNNGGKLTIAINGKDLILPPGLSSTKMDNRILSTAIHLQRDNPDKKIVLISNDINLRLIAEAFDIKAEEHKSDRLTEQNIYSGFKEFKVSKNIIDEFYQNKELSIEKINSDLQLFPQEMVHLTAYSDKNKSAIGRFNGKVIKKLRFDKKHPSGISPLNREQTMAFELLLDDEVKLVTIAGKAGTGKTLLALAAGLSKVVDRKQYKRLLVARPVIPMGKDIGFLPGTKEDKMQPWMQPIFDNLDFILNSNKKSSYTFEKLVEEDLIQIEALTYIRGRSVPDQFIIIDEAQNLSHHEVKTIITRAGQGTKIVLTGDPYQIDNPYLNFYKNGLTYLAYKFHDKKIGGHVMLEKGERSELARIASEIL